MIYIFDVDNTLTPPREPMTDTFAADFLAFCRGQPVYLVTGSDHGKLTDQVPADIITACAGVFTSAGSRFESGGKVVYEHDHEFPDDLIGWLDGQLAASRYPVRLGRHIEYRTGSLNVSTVGRGADRTARRAYLAWDQAHREREALRRRIEEHFPDYEAHIGGEISVDISPKGWNKARILVPVRERHGNEPVTFIADNVEPGGNDWPLAEALKKDPCGNAVVPVGDWRDTAREMKKLRQTRNALSA